MKIIKYPKVIFLYIAFWFCTANQLLGQEWQPMPPYGGIIRSALSLNNELLVGTDAGVYKSTDGGNNFMPLSKSIPSGRLTNMVEVDGVILACIIDTGIFRSFDGGIHWTKLLSGRFLVNGYQPFLKIGNTIVIRSYGAGSIRDSIYITEDKGNTWIGKPIKTDVYYPLFSANGNLFSYSNQGRLGPQTGLYRSEDLGTTWTYSAAGLPPNQHISVVFSINDTVYTLGKYFYRSLDNGATWTEASTDSALGVRTLSPNWYGINGRTIYGHRGGNAQLVVAQWTPGDAGWKVVMDNLPNAGQAEILYAHQGEMFISRWNGNYRKRNNDAKWESFAPEGVNGIPIADIATRGGEVIAVSTPNLLQASENMPAWSLTNPAVILDNYPFHTIARTDSGLVLGLSAGSSLLSTRFSGNGGLNWTNSRFLNMSAAKSNVLNLGDTLVFYGGDASGKCILADQKGVSRADISSSLYGLKWDVRVTGLTQHNGYLYAVISAIEKPWHSVVSRFKPGLSTNWERVVTNFSGVNFGAFAIGSYGNYLVLSPLSGGIKMSSDNGVTWFDRADGFKNAVANHFLVVGDTLYAATNKGVFRLPQGDTTWQDISGNIPTSTIDKIAVSDNIIWALARGGGVWRLPRGNFQIPLGTIGNIDHKSPLHIYPNPVAHTLQITSRNNQPGALRIYDMQGKVVMTIPFAGGVQQQSLAVGHLTAGMYMVVLETQQRTEMARFIKD
jgi:hypothetical protein